MAYRYAIGFSRSCLYSKYVHRNNNSVLITDLLPSLSEQRRDYHRQNKESNNGRQGENGTWNRKTKYAAGIGLSASLTISGIALQSYLEEENTKSINLKKINLGRPLLAEENDEKKVKEMEATFRRTQTLDKIFDYFATYRYINKKGKNVNLMSIKDFYNAVIPGSSITHGTGMKSEKDYIIVTDEDITSDKLYQSEEIPVPNSILNKIQRQGLLSYTDFCFLMNILATPLRYLDIEFLAFDITADGNINSNEYLKVLTKITKHTGGLGRYDDCGTPEELTKANYSGLMNYLFGPKRRKKMTKDAFLKFRGQMIDELLYLQFTRFCHDLPDLPNIPKQQFPIITDVEFCEHLLANLNIPSKKKAQMIKRVTKFYGESSTNPTQLAEGITFDEFRSFYHVLYCGADFERAMYFYDLDHGGITKGQFVELSQWISDMEVDSHLVDVIFLLLDEDGHQLLSIQDFHPLLEEWRHSRGYLQASAPGAAIIDLKLA